MKLKITFEKTAPYFEFGQRADLRVTFKFSHCTFEDFHYWLDKNREKLRNMSLDIDIGYSDMVIIFWRK